MKILTLLFLVVLALNATAQQKATPLTSMHAGQVCTGDLHWNDTKPPLLPGAEVAIIEGNPKADGHFTMRIKFPPYYKIPPHTHPVDERTTVLSGILSIGFGDVLDTTNAKRLTEGCFYLNPKGVHHYFFTSEEETVIQISTNGPWGLDLIKK